MIGALALLAATSTASASTDARVVILPSITLDRGGGVRAVDEPTRALFDEAFRDAAEGTFLARRLEVVERDVTDAFTREVVGDVLCVTSACAHQIARRSEATSWLVGVIVRNDAGCRARATLFDMTRARVAQRLDQDVAPCTPDRVLRAAEDLGQRIADGPRRPQPVGLSLTPLSLPEVGLEDIDDLEFTFTSTTERTKQIGVSPERAIALYHKHEFALRPNAQGYMMAVRGRTPISDCDLMVAAGRKATREELMSCSGNWWELAYLTAPVGAVMLIPVLGADEPSIALGGLAVTLLVSGPLLALAYNRDAHDPSEGEHVVPLDDLEDLVVRANATLRRELGLSEAEVIASRR